MQTIKTKNGTTLTIDPLTTKVLSSSNLSLIGTNIYSIFHQGKDKVAKIELSSPLSETVATLEITPEDASMINVCHQWALGELNIKIG